MEKEKHKKLWFKSKTYGWGWVPVSWEGWVVLAVYLLLVVGDFRFINASQHSVSDTFISFVPRFIFLSVVLVALCYWKGEKPRWRWGDKK
jgi:hypothetical protein